MHDHAVVTTFSLVLVILKNNAIFARLKSNYLKNLNNMRKFFGILAFAAAFFGMTACEEEIVEEGAVVIYDGPVALADQGFGMYYGDKNFNSVGVYSVVLSDAICFRDGFGAPYLDSEGDMLVLEFLAELKDADAPVGLPEGKYQITADTEVLPRINTSVSYVKRLVGSVQYQYTLESGSINISKNAQGTYDLETQDLVIKKGNERHEVYYSYSGALKIDEWSKVAAEIQDLKSDVIDMPFPYVSPVYYGNLFGYGTGNYVVTLATDGFMEDETGTVPGVALILNMFGELVPGDNAILLKEGTYTVYPDFNYHEFSMLYGLNMDGVPFGTYLAQIDAKGTQSIEFINGGTVEVSRASVNYDDVYTLKYNLNTTSRKVTGTWVGALEFLDASEGSGRVVLSTLDGDVDCDMSKVERGLMAQVETLMTTYEPVAIAEAWQLWLEPRMWTEEEKKLPWEERIEAWDPNGDIMILEFVVPLNTRGDIAPELNKEYKYTIQPNLSMEDPLYQVSVSKMGRPYDDIFYQPYWKDRYTYMTGVDARRGFTWQGGYRGNWYLHYIPGTYQNMDEMAPAVKGTVTVTRTSDYRMNIGEREADFNIVWDLYDDAEASYNITGEWSGPITLSNEFAGDEGDDNIEFE